MLGELLEHGCINHLLFSLLLSHLLFVLDTKSEKNYLPLQRNEYMQSFKSIKKCHCGRPWCEYFASGIGDEGKSFSRGDLESELEAAKENVSILENLLNNSISSIKKEDYGNK